jgi:CRISPR-associated protein Csb2
VGRKPDGSSDGPIDARVRLVPLPSVGHLHADRGIRRILVQVPAGCSLDAGDVHWAFSGLDLADHDTGEVLAILTPAADDAIIDHYGIADGPSPRTWRSVTPIVLPQAAARRRIEPSRKIEEAKEGSERFAEQARAAISVRQALRHAGVQQWPEAIRLQREPFESNGARVEAFADGTRFAKERLWHVEIAFDAPILGPLVIGDGRFLGLGVMAPVRTTEGIHAFVVNSGLIEKPDPTEVARAARRAVMARVQDVLGFSDTLPAFFSGHEAHGAPASTSHLAFAFDPRTPRVLIVAPHILDRRDPTWEEKRHLSTLERALERFEQLRAGSAGQLELRQTSVDMDSDSLMAPSRVWESVTPYLVTRHAKSGGAGEALVTDLRADCRRRGLPEPLEVIPLESRGLPNVGLLGRARVTFAIALKGPILLGKSRYQGGGLFAPIGGSPER